MRTLAIALIAAGFALPAAAQTLYKLIHPDGKVEYAEKPPKEFPGKVIRLDVNPESNKATLPRFEPKARPESRVPAARDKLDKARKALKDAEDNPSEGDVMRVGNVGGGTRPVNTEAYDEKLKKLREAVKAAEDDLRAAEGGR